MKRALLYLAAGLALLTGGEWVREQFSAHTVDLRAFDGKAVGRLDTIMWRSYYERRPAALFGQLVETLETQFHMPPMRAVLNAYRAAHAAFVFKDGHNRAEYEHALPDLQRYFTDISRQATSPFDPDKAARLELEWWILHRERSTELAKALAAVQAEVYHVPADALMEHARLRAEAMVLRDEKGSQISAADWERIGAMLDRSWVSLKAAVTAYARTSSLRGVQ